MGVFYGMIFVIVLVLGLLIGLFGIDWLVCCGDWCWLVWGLVIGLVIVLLFYWMVFNIVLLVWGLVMLCLLGIVLLIFYGLMFGMI